MDSDDELEEQSRLEEESLAGSIESLGKNGGGSWFGGGNQEEGEFLEEVREYG